MRILHLADLHLGKHLAEYPLAEDQRHILAQALRIADEREADALVVAGDVYDKTAPSAEAVALLDWFLTEVAARKLPCFIVPGNHDSAERIAYAGSLLARQGIHIAPVFAGEMAHYALEDEHGPVTFWLLPFVKPAHVRPLFPEAKIERDYTAAVRAVVDAADVDTAQRNVIVAHQFVTAGSTAPERSDSELSLGGLDNVDAGVFETFDYVALGHVHRPQRIGRDTARYAGSPLKYSLSETAGEKSACLVELGPKGQVEIELVPFTPLHDLRAVKGPLEEITSPEVLAGHDVEDYLHVTLTDEEPRLDALARLRAVFPRLVSFDYDNERTRAAGAERASEVALDMERTPPDALFAEFYERQNGTALSEAHLRIVRDTLDGAGAGAEPGKESA